MTLQTFGTEQNHHHTQRSVQEAEEVEIPVSTFQLFTWSATLPVFVKICGRCCRFFARIFWLVHRMTFIFRLNCWSDDGKQIGVQHNAILLKNVTKIEVFWPADAFRCKWYANFKTHRSTASLLSTRRHSFKLKHFGAESKKPVAPSCV
jgi:hypothetical protein